MSPSIYIWAHSCTLAWFPLPVQMIYTDVTVGTHDNGGRIYITAEAQCIKWVEEIHPLLTQVVKVNLSVQFSIAMDDLHNLQFVVPVFELCRSLLRTEVTLEKSAIGQINVSVMDE